MTLLFLLTVLTAAVTAQVTSGCPAECECPAAPPVCPPGVSAVPDGCGCCTACAAQLNQDCGRMRPCDRHKGLECNYGNDVTTAWGICRAKSEGRTCEYNGRIHQNGESFRAGCKHQCTCIDGAVGCAPLCANKLPPASPHCPYPSLVRMPGQCCFSVDCHGSTRRLPPKMQVLPSQQHLPGSRHPARRRPENEPLFSNKLTDGWESGRGFQRLPDWNHLEVKTCPTQTTDWSQCSRSCGMGVSSRITNNNPQCKLERETRICTVRPCAGPTLPVKEGRSCSPTHKAPAPIRLSYGECASVRLYRPNYCGACTNGRCCSPRRTRTVPVSFVCPDGERFRRSAMLIQSCKCSADCGHLNEVALPPQRWLHGDTHKFID